jgi:arginase family enzyme
MDFADYFNKVDAEKLLPKETGKGDKYSLAHIISNFEEKAIRSSQIAILGVPEQRNSNNKGTANAPDKIREQLYKLNFSGKLSIVDLGNMILGKSLNDTYAAITEILSDLIQNSVIPIILGGSQDLTYAVYSAYNKIDKPISIVSIDPKFDLGYQKNIFDYESYLGQIILEKGKNLYNYTNLGYQSYYVNKDELKLFNKLNFDSFRLGQIRSNIEDIEPVLRDADMVCVDIRSIKQSDAPAHRFPSPNGFYSEEICQLARYAGLSDKVTSFGLFDLNPKYDINEITSGLAAQIIWYFIDGVNVRQKDFPKENSHDYTKHIISFEKTEQNIVFYQNNYNKRWWMEVKLQGGTKKNKLVACTFNDYKLACNQELPDRWLKTVQRLS